VETYTVAIAMAGRWCTNIPEVVCWSGDSACVSS
jgi:hypothetical protein